MEFWIQLTISVALFLVGVRLSAFFSGSESGFYRVSFLRLSIDAHAGDKVAKRLMWFVQHPEYFVATTLVGNNIANYVTTLAIGMGATCLVTSAGPVFEIVSTLLFTPVIFVFGEVMPKNLYFRAPTLLLRRGARVFQWCYRGFLPVTVPLVWMTRLVEKLTGAKRHQLDLVLGRHRLVQVLNTGHEHGLLTTEQGHLVHGLLHDASRPATDLMTPATRILGEDEAASRETLIKFARDFGVTLIPLRRSVKPLPLAIVDHTATRLTALLTMRETSSALGLVQRDGKTLGLLNQRALIDRFMRPKASPRPRRAALGVVAPTASDTSV
jgi:putative hemolysin